MNKKKKEQEIMYLRLEFETETLKRYVDLLEQNLLLDESKGDKIEWKKLNNYRIQAKDSFQALYDAYDYIKENNTKKNKK